jgi:hypothetical protein
MRISAVRALEALGYCYEGGRWLPKIRATPLIHLTAEADAMHAVLMRRADTLAGSAGAEEEAELLAISSVLGAYEAKRWPDDKEPRLR